MHTHRKVGLVVGAIVAAAVVAALAVLLPREVAAPAIAGMVRQTEIRIAPEITGRLVSIPVHAGQAVRKGELLAVLDNPELAASLATSTPGFAPRKSQSWPRRRKRPRPT